MYRLTFRFLETEDEHFYQMDEFNLSFANNQAESKGIHLPAHAWVLYLAEHRLDQMNSTRM
jgi:hypothetical protein